jgi:hypothetical protein
VLAFPVARRDEEPYPWQIRTRRERDLSPWYATSPLDNAEIVESTVVAAATVAEWSTAEQPHAEADWSAAQWQRLR